MNKCKTELQYWRSKSTTLLALPSTCASCSAPLLPSQSAEDAEAELKALANQGIFLTDDLTEEVEVQKGSAMENGEQAGTSASASEAVLASAAAAGPSSPMETRGTCKSGPPSPVSAVVRKRRSRDDLAVEEASLDADSNRKSSLRNGTSGAPKNTRFKRPKTVSSS